MNNIELLISESIKTGKWLDISYKNKQNETTYYWIAIKDIDLTKRILIVTIYNDYKSFECLDAFIKVDNILSAKILEFTTYEVPQELIDKIEHNKEAAKWLHYESFNNNILKYYLKCNELDNDPYQKISFFDCGSGLGFSGRIIADMSIVYHAVVNLAEHLIDSLAPQTGRRIIVNAVGRLGNKACFKNSVLILWSAGSRIMLRLIVIVIPMTVFIIPTDKQVAACVKLRSPYLKVL